MFHLTIPAGELWDEVNECFIYVEEQTLKLEHSLVSLSKWESKWCKPFLTPKAKSWAETVDYIRCMTLTQNVDPNIYKRLTPSMVSDIEKYMDAPMTATTINSKDKHGRKEQPTAEVIYYWMISQNIPLDPCQKWHLNRLLMLIRVCSIKNSPQKPMSNSEILDQTAAINAARRAKLTTKG